jgi:hypothetical protein
VEVYGDDSPASRAIEQRDEPRRPSGGIHGARGSTLPRPPAR